VVRVRTPVNITVAASNPGLAEVCSTKLSHMSSPALSSFAAYDAYPITWCCIQKLCIKSGEGRYGP
jgi:hypothetical protein